MSFLYFAYGSNLLRERLLLKNPSAIFVAIAKLKDYKLQFCAKSGKTLDLRWEGGTASIREAEGHSVWGVVWELDQKHLASLDEQEEVNKNVYHRLEKLRVTTPTPVAGDQLVLECVSYQYVEPVYIPPSPQYLTVIQTGARQQCLPEEYQRLLASIEHNGYQGPLPLFDNLMASLKP